jgi:hypothetical protein
MYPVSAWAQIVAELIFLIVILATASAGLFQIGLHIVLGAQVHPLPAFVGQYPSNRRLLLLLIIGLSGACGGSSASLKWLYHTVAKQRWHRDRLIWRLVVPILSAVLAVFTGLMIDSGLIPFVTGKSLSTPAVCGGLGFFVGLFSDNVLGSLQRLAFRIFGTVDKQTPRNDDIATQEGASAEQARE